MRRQSLAATLQLPPQASSVPRDDRTGSVLLDAIATRWGCTGVDGGKVMWFDLDLCAGEPPLPRQAAG